MNKILIIGKKSFVGSYLYIHLSKFYKIKALNFEEAYKKKNSFYDDFTHVINTSIHKYYINKRYNKHYDLDRKFISKFNKINFKYIFLNTRKIYLSKENISELSSLRPNDFYSKNKLKTEKCLKLKLRKKLISLRISNIIGKRIYSKHRDTHKLFFDNFLIYKKKKKKLDVKNIFKDFLSIQQFCLIMNKIIKFNINGTYNVSLSRRVFLSEIIYWMDKEYHKKINFIPSIKGSFTLSNKKLINKIKIKLSKKQLRLFCENLI